MKWLPSLCKGYIYSTGALLCAIGAMLVLITWTCTERGIQPWLNEPAPLFGLANRSMFLLAGALHLALGGCLLITRDLINQELLVFWTGLNSLLYRIAMMWILKLGAPLPMENFVGWRIGARPAVVDCCWKLFIAYMIIGSSLLMLLKWQQLKKLKDEAWFRNWQAAREQGLLAAKPVIQQSLADTKGRTIISCPLCGGHLECPSHAVGQTTTCLHCTAIITLKAHN